MMIEPSLYKMEPLQIVAYEPDTFNTFVNQTLNQIKIDLNKVEFQKVWDNLNLLCKELKIIENEDGFILQLFFDSAEERRAVQLAIIKRCREPLPEGFDEWQINSHRNLYSLELSMLQTSYLLGRDSYLPFYMQPLLKKLKEFCGYSHSFTKLPNEFLLRLFKKYLTIKDLGRFSQTNKKNCSFINSNENNLIWKTIAATYKLNIKLESNKTFKEQIKDPWEETAFGKINQRTYDIIINKRTFVTPSFLEPIFTEYIPKDYYLEFQYLVLECIPTYLIFFCGEFNEPQYHVTTNKSQVDKIIEALSKTFKRCTGTLEKDLKLEYIPK